jgi:hypothetical protein
MEVDEEMAVVRGMIEVLTRPPFNGNSGDGHATVHWHASKFWDQRMDWP